MLTAATNVRMLVWVALCTLMSGCVVARYPTVPLPGQYDHQPSLGNPVPYVYTFPRYPQPYDLRGFRVLPPDHRDVSRGLSGRRSYFPEYGLKCDPRRAVCYKWSERRDRWQPDRSETRDYFGKKAAKRLKREFNHD